MKDEWKRVFLRKMMFFGLPGIFMLLLPILFGTPILFPIFIPPFAILIGIPLVEIFSHYFPDLFSSHRWRDRPKPTFSIIRGLAKQGQFDEALNQLQAMSRTDPQEVEIWLEMLEIALIDLKNREMGDRFYREALSALETQKNRDLVQRFYTNIG